MNYLIMRIGKMINFNPKKWSSLGGDNESPTIIKTLSYYNPNDNFIVCSQSDILSCSTISPNIKYVYMNEPKYKNYKDIPADGIIQGLKRLKITQIDGVLVFCGMNSPRNDAYVNIDKCLYFVLKFCRPIFHFLNQTKCKYFCLSFDPRTNFIKPRDLFNVPVKILSQYDYQYKMRVWDNKTDHHIVDIGTAKLYYSGIEKTYLIDKKKPNVNNFVKTDKFNIILNEGNKDYSRFKDIKKYVIDCLDDYKIYGNWFNPEMLSNPNFKGPVPFTETQNILQKTKYTLIIPITPGWVTSKYVEMIQNGVVPFFSDDYDTQNHVKIPNFLRVTNGKELQEKINILENDETLYKSILNELIALFDDDDYSGKRINDLIMNEFKTINYHFNI